MLATIFEHVVIFAPALVGIAILVTMLGVACISQIERSPND